MFVASEVYSFYCLTNQINLSRIYKTLAFRWFLKRNQWRDVRPTYPQFRGLQNNEIDKQFKQERFSQVCLISTAQIWVQIDILPPNHWNLKAKEVINYGFYPKETERHSILWANLFRKVLITKILKARINLTIKSKWKLFQSNPQWGSTSQRTVWWTKFYHNIKTPAKCIFRTPGVNFSAISTKLTFTSTKTSPKSSNYQTLQTIK